MRPGGARNDTHGTGSTQMSAIDGAIAAFAARQHGVVTRAQLLAAGIAPDTVRSRVRTRRLVPVHHGVYRVGPVVDPRAREMAAS